MICHVNVTFLSLQRTVKYLNEQGLKTLHLLHEEKQILTYMVDVAQVIISGNLKRSDI